MMLEQKNLDVEEQKKKLSKKEKPKVAKKVSKLSDFKSMGDMLNTVDVKIKKQERHK